MEPVTATRMSVLLERGRVKTRFGLWCAFDVTTDTLLLTALKASQAEPVERIWSFLIFCGVINLGAHDAFVSLATDVLPQVERLAAALSEASTPRGRQEDQGLAEQLWRYYNVGRRLEADQSLAPSPPDELNWQPRLSPCVEITD